MFRAVPRHNVNLTAEELRWVLDGARGKAHDPEGLVRFEEDARRFFGVAHAIAVESGRAALHLALCGLGLKPGAVVVLPRYCFFSLIKVVEGMGCTARYAPVDPETFAIDPSRLDPYLDGASAVVIIHPFGQVADMIGLQTVCSSRGIPIVEDASQATGARMGRLRAGAMGEVGVFSLVSGKNLQTFGGGLLLTQRDSVARLVRTRLSGSTQVDPATVKKAFRDGLQRWFLTTPLGFRGLMHPVTRTLDVLAPSKLDALTHEERRPYDAERMVRKLSDVQGALGCMELAELDRRNAKRRSNALRLLERLSGIHGIQLPLFNAEAENSFNAVAIRSVWARELAQRLRQAGFDTRTDYMEWFGGEQDFDEDVLYLPNHPAMSTDDIDRLAQAVRAALLPS